MNWFGVLLVAFTGIFANVQVGVAAPPGSSCDGAADECMSAANGKYQKVAVQFEETFQSCMANCEPWPDLFEKVCTGLCEKKHEKAMTRLAKRLEGAGALCEAKKAECEELCALEGTCCPAVESPVCSCAPGEVVVTGTQLTRGVVR